MNSLNLRVSAVKTGENVKKNAEMRASLIQLPKVYETCEESYCVNFKKAASIPEQVTVIKSAFKCLDEELKVLQFLTDVYFSCPLKHPVRNQIMKLLITAARLGTYGMEDTLIVNALAQSIQHLMEDTRNSCDADKWNFTVTSFNGCFENFECGVKALRVEITEVFKFLHTALQKYLLELRDIKSPSGVNDHYLYIHNVVRFLLSCLPEMSSHILEIEADQLSSLYEICRIIIHTDDIPMDPRTNAGILMAHISKISKEYVKFIKYATTTTNPNEIVLCVGVINTIGHTSFLRLSSDIRDICDNVVKISNNHSTVPNLLLCATRGLYQLSKIILNFTDLIAHEVAINDAKLILRRLMMYTLGHMEHHMDSIRHLCRDLLRNILGASKFIKFEFLAQKLLSSCNAENYSISMKCIILQQVAHVMGASEVMRKCPNLFNELFSDYLGLDHSVNSLFEVLLTTSHKELNFELWFDTWVLYLLGISSCNDARLSDTEGLLVKAVRLEPKIAQIIVEHEKPVIPTSTKLSALWAIRKFGFKIENFDGIMQKFSKALVLSLISNSDETRIMALRLLVETHRTTELLSELECKNLITYLEYNANCQSPATRQKSLALLDKALIRLELSMLKSLRAVGEAEARKEVANESIHFPFLREFLRVLVSNLFTGANFSRRSISLQLLEKCIRLCISCNLMLTDFLPMGKIDSVVNALTDSYEANKELAVRILKLIENEVHENLIEAYGLDINVETIYVQLVSVRPLTSMTGAYTLDFFCNSAQSHDFGDFEHVDYEPTYFAAISWMLANLKSGLVTAEQSLLRAAKVNPLYGILFAIRHLLKHLNYKEMAKYSDWRFVIAQLILLCKKLTIVVGIVVNNSSPEGHLPNDFNGFPQEFLDANLQSLEGEDWQDINEMPSSSINCYTNLAVKAVNEFDMENQRTTPQMVLLCAWRTVKEVSLILGDIVLNAPIHSNDSESDEACAYVRVNDDEEFLVTTQQILQIGDHFKELLTETKHRGAFEQAFLGFSKLCVRLWCFGTSELNELPMKWLIELMNIISSDEKLNDKLSATRRSAGVPFMVQALITSEIHVGTTKSLNYCMHTLLELCNDGKYSSEARTHAMNILRALFRCTDLNDAVGKYICEGIMCALRSYEADNWSEKNSATLLFAALIIRIFGVQRTKDSDNLNVRNKMTGHIFFLRYPQLYDFLSEELTKATQLVEQEKKAPKLPLILLILCRLYPSSLEGSESSYLLSSFAPHLLACAGCAELHTRKLAANALAAITSADAIDPMLLNACTSLVSATQGEVKYNKMHGILLQIRKLLDARKLVEKDRLSRDILYTLASIHSRHCAENSMILSAMFDIATEIWKRLNSTGFVDDVSTLFGFFKSLEDEVIKSPNWNTALYKSFYMFKIYTLKKFDVLDFLVTPVSESWATLHTELSLNLILLILLRDQAKNYRIDDTLEEFEILEEEYEYVSELDVSLLQFLAQKLRSNVQLNQLLKDTFKQEILYPEGIMKAYAVYSYIDSCEFTLSQLITEARKHPADVKSAITMCIKRVAMKDSMEFMGAQHCVEYLLEITLSHNPDYLRFRAAGILAHIAKFFEEAFERRSIWFIRQYTKLLLRLLMDDVFEIRDFVAELVLQNIRTRFEMETVVSTMAQRLFLQDIAELLKITKAEDDFVCRVFRTIVEEMTSGIAADDGTDDKSTTSSETSSAITELEIFDKNESNAFAEPIKVIKDMRVVYERAFKQRPVVMHCIRSFENI